MLIALGTHDSMLVLEMACGTPVHLLLMHLQEHLRLLLRYELNEGAYRRLRDRLKQLLVRIFLRFFFFFFFFFLLCSFVSPPPLILLCCVFAFLCRLLFSFSFSFSFLA